MGENAFHMVFQERWVFSHSSPNPALAATRLWAGYCELVGENSISPGKPYEMHILSVLTEQVTLGRLPAPEPDKFKGDPLLCPGWRSAFHILIERRGIPDIEKIHYLGRYVQGPAKDAIIGFLQLTSPDMFHNAITI